MNSTAAPTATNSGEPRIVIIGGGIAGLSAGIFARANGFDATILEKHTILGGECTPMKDLWRSVGAVGLAEYAERFQHPAIRAMFATFAPGDYAVAFLFFGLATFAQGPSSIPIGGSKALADRMAERYLAMGGDVETGCEVTKVAIEGCSLLAGRPSRSSPARTPSSDSARN